uniref:Thiamin biosynthesis protein S n=1 Tax=Antithamnionella ternifolia TaxID=207919 RepID=A0A4D6WKC1_9FLOR|nr:Thiamin biosynthesis protein S [Antithamnionella ternifolia]
MNKKYYTILINGEPFNCYSTMSLKDLLTYLNLNIHTVIIEYNQLVVNSSQFETILLNKDDHIEIITIVGGG